MQGMFSKLSSYAALLGVIGGIGAGFAAFGEFNNRIAQLENKEFVVNETVDLSGINQKIEDVIKAIEGVKADAKINDAAIKFLDAKIEELKASLDNPLL
jgi:prefoldin subunit 5|tara:strand:- start:148 stop:444 length:297 start_codon:yes stop_codon:yes gene_type:complete